MNCFAHSIAAIGGLGPWNSAALFTAPILALAGTAWCVALMRKPATSLLCVMALAAALLGGTAGFVAHLLQEDLGRLWLGVVLLASGALAAAGLVCGCVGLALHRRMGCEHGRAHGIWGIALNALLLGGGMTFFILKFSGEEQGAKPTAAVPQLDSKNTKTVMLYDGNCRLTYPRSRWIESSSPERFEKGAALALRFIRHDLLLTLTWTHDDGDAEFHMRSIRGRLGLNAPGIETAMEVKERFGDVEFLRFDGNGTASKSALPMAYTFWFAAHGGTVYQIHTQCLPLGAKEALDETRQVLSTFALIDPAQNVVARKPAPAATPKPPAPSTGQPTMNDFLAAFRQSLSDQRVPNGGALEEARPEVAGFSTGLAPLGWKSWTDGTGGTAGAQFTARLGLVSYCVAYSIPLVEKGAGIEDLAKVLLPGRDGAPRPEGEPKAEPFSIPGAQQALRIAEERTVNGIKFRFRKIIAIAGKRGFSFYAWQVNNAVTTEHELDDALATIQISTGTETLPPARLEPQRRFQASVLHELGILASQRGEWARAVALFQSAYRISEHNDLTLASIATCLEETGDASGALATLGAHPDRVRKSSALRASLARCKQLLGDFDGACADFAVAFRDGHHDENDMSNYLGCLLRQSKKDEAKKIADDFAAKAGTARARRLQAYIHANAGDSDGALRMFEDILAKPPFDPIAEAEFGEAANVAGKFDKAAGAAASLLKAGHDSAQTRLIEGWSHFGKKEWREAKASFEKARAFQPNSGEAADALLRASAMLGEGDNSAVKNPIAANEIPAATLAEIEKAGREITPPMGAGAWYLMRATVLSYRKGEPFSRTLHRKIHIADQASVSDFSTLHFPFDPLSEEIFVNRLTVADENGNVVARGQPGEQYVIDQSTFSSEATHHKMLRVVVPGLKPGRTLEFAVTTRDRAKSDEFPFQRNLIGTLNPVFAEAIVISGDVGDMRGEASAAFEKLAQKSETRDTIAWLLREPPQWHMESLLPPSDDYMPVLSLGDSKADWKDVSRKYLGQIESLLAPDAEVAKLATELTADLKGTEEKVRALTRHVQKNVTYQAIEFGRRARIPKPAARAIASHYGDCKDQAVLLHQLLSGAGIESYLALVNSAAGTKATLPSLDQFNHMIVRVPALKAAFVDPTNSHLPGGVLPPEFFRHQALVLDPANPRLEALPERRQFPTDHMGVDTDIALSADGEMQVRETFRVSGYHAIWLRSWLAEVQPSERLASVQRWITDARWHLQDVAIEALEQDEADLVLKLQYSIPRATAPGPAAAAIVLPAIWERQFLVGAFLKERHQPFELLHPLTLDSRVTVRTPRQPSAEALKAFSRTGNNEFCKWEARVIPGAIKNAPLSFSFHFEGADGVFPASRYPAWQSAGSAAVEAWQSPIKLD